MPKKGFKFSLESRKKMSLAKKGKPTWNKGTAIPGRKKAYMKEWQRKNKEKHSEYIKEWKKNNPDKVKKLYEYKQNWRKEHPEREKNHQQSRKARLLGAMVNDFTSEQWVELLIEFDSRCAYCEIRSSNLTQDHIIPLSRGGNHTKANIVPACGHCNCRKNDLIFSEDIESNYNLFKEYLKKEKYD